MWLQIRLMLLVGLMLSILYFIIAAISYTFGIRGYSYYFILIGFAILIVIIQYLIGPKTVEWSMKIKYVSESQYPKLFQMVREQSDNAGLPNAPKIGVSQLKIPNAFAFGRSQRSARVCVTQGILDILGIQGHVLGAFILGFPAVKYLRTTPRSPLKIKGLEDL